MGAALLKFVFWWSSIIAALTVDSASSAKVTAFVPNRQGRRMLPAQLIRTSTVRCRVIGAPSSGPSLLLATKHSDAWDLRYEELMSYKDEYGDCNVPHSMGGLGNWVFNQRISYTKGSLSRERVGRLEEIGFTWRFVATDEADVLTKLRYWEELWDWRYRELKQYRDKHGDCNVPKSQGGLGTWVDTQRHSYKKAKLSDERIARLESIGFVWDLREQEWLDRCNELTDFKAENDDCNVPQSQGPLGMWVNNQRTSYKKGKLSDERITRLESIGFVWEPLDLVWMACFDELVDFKCENGDCNVPHAQGPLGVWVGFQRQYYKKGKLSQERVDLLESIGFSWEPLDEAWTTRFDELVDFKNEIGDCNVPHSQGPLNVWVNRQRTTYKNGKLSQERIELLESIGFEWILRQPTHTNLSWKLDEQWRTKFTELVHYLIEHGNCNVPYGYGPLGSWVGKQRKTYTDGSMSQFRVDYLDSIGFAWKLKRVGKEAHPDQYSEPDTKAIARIIEDEKPRHDDLPASATEGLKTRANVGRCLAEALQEYLDDDTVRLMQTFDKPQRFGMQWQARYTELVYYLIARGNCNVPRKQGALGNWVNSQRRNYREGRLSQIRKEYLESIGFVWTTKRVGNEWHPDQYSKPDPKAIARIIVDEKSGLEEFPSSAPEGLKVRVKADRALVEALQKYLDKLENK